MGGAVLWDGENGTLTDCIFINNNASVHVGAVSWGGVNGTLINSTFSGNTGRWGGAVSWGGVNGTLINSTFSGNTASWDGGAVIWDNVNGTLTGCTFIDNDSTSYGGAVSWHGANSNMFNCKFTGNKASDGDNVYWVWTAEEFLNKYSQINDYDYVFINGGVGTPNSTIVLNKKGIIISGKSVTVIFDGQGKNLHFEITGSDVLVEFLTFRNFNFIYKKL